MNKFVVALGLCVPLLYSNISFAENNTMVPEQKFLVGTWSGMPENSKLSSDFASQGIYTVKLNSDGTLLPLSELKMQDPSWITFSKNYKFAYVTNEKADGTVSAVAVESDGKLTEINHVKSLGDHPTHSTLSQDGKFLFVANYSVGPNKSGITVLPILANGALGEAVQNIKFIEGSNVVAGRQNSGHAHSVTFSPDGKVLYAADLGADIVRAYEYHANDKLPLHANPALDLVFAKGSGPRHMVFSENGKFAYVTSEMNAEVVVFEKVGKKMVQIQKELLAKRDHESQKSASGLIFSPDNKFLYVGNRKDVNEIVTYKVDEATGKLTLVGHYTSGGVEPRAFSMDKTGEYLLISNVHSHTVSEFKRNKETGALTPTRIALQIGQPTDIKFIP
ncbi:lactonase family protein [Acinetobacter nectaris]|uniref:lactonase family protein n=1 Tax=Acinetobacter nectaris TaxID=1219382 RepID=UPI001F30B04C|nr:lactonase family protein [Acinetobacter nectaris]MCF9033746.1 lactonase family protein [Acinetobacter nectaris]